MESIKISEIIKATRGKLISGNTDSIITSVCIDSRKIENNCLFVPIIGEKVDAHNFINYAFESGATASLVQEGYNKGNLTGTIIEVKCTRTALQDIAKYYRKKFQIPMIGITGSVGKTTTKEMIAAVLSETLKVFKNPGNFNSQIGLPLTILSLDASYDVAVLEMGISKLGEMKKLADIADVDIGVITNIGVSHIENFKKTEITRDEKMKIIKKSEGTFYLNGDSPLLSNLQDKISQKIIYFGINGSYPYRCEDVYSNEDSTNFVLVTDEFKENITIPCLGIHNVYNSLVAIAIARDMGLHIDDIKKGLAKFKNSEMRQQILNIHGITLIDDSYNASPDSVKSAVSVLRNMKTSGKNIVVMADMLELGNASEDIHFETGRYIAIEGIDILITIGDKAKFLSDGAKIANQSIETFNFDSNQEAFEKLISVISKNDKILIKGSRGMHTEEIVSSLKNHLKN